MLDTQRKVATNIMNQALLALDVFEKTGKREQFVAFLDQVRAAYRNEFERGVTMADEEMNTGEGDNQEESNQETVEACPSYGKAWDGRAEDCRACAGVFPDEHDECKKLTLQRKGKRVVPDQEAKVQTALGEIPVEQQDESKPKLEPGEVLEPRKERKKVSRNATGGLSVQQFCLKLIKEGKNEQEVKEALKQVYMGDGKDEKYAKGRANAVFSWALKQAK